MFPASRTHWGPQPVPRVGVPCAQAPARCFSSLWLRPRCCVLVVAAAAAAPVIPTLPAGCPWKPAGGLGLVQGRRQLFSATLNPCRVNLLPFLEEPSSDQVISQVRSQARDPKTTPLWSLQEILKTWCGDFLPVCW